MISCGEDIAV